MDQAAFQNLKLEDILELLHRRRIWVVIAGALGLFCGVAAWQLLPPLYVATTTLLVEPQGVPESFVRSTITLELEERIDTLRQRVSSHANLNALIDRLGADRLSSGRGREAVMKEIRGNLEVEIENRHGSAAVISLSYVDDDPLLAADIVREVAALYMAENTKDRAQQASSTASFLDQELTRLREDMAEREALISDFRAEHLGALPSQLETNLNELDRLNSSLEVNLRTQDQYRHELAAVRAGGRNTVMVHRMSDGMSQTYAGAEGPPDLAAALNEARVRLLDLRLRYTDEHPSVTALVARVADLERQLDEHAAKVGGHQLSRGARDEIQQLEVSLHGHKREESDIRKRIALVEKRVEETPRNGELLTSLSRDYENMTSTYEKLVTNRHDAALAKNLEEAQMSERFKVLRPAMVPSRPSWPNPFLMIPGGLGIGLALAALAILIAEIRRPAFHSVKRLTDQLGLPVFASIPELDPKQFGGAESLGIDWRIVAHTAPDSAAAEQYRGFLPFFLESEDCRTVLVTSASAGDGKSMTCLNLACTLAADLNRRVLVIDADLRRATVHNLIGVRRGPGLSDVLMGNAELSDCIVDPLPNVSVLPAGTPVRRFLALLTGEGFSKLRQRASEDFDIVLIDSPPILPVIDTRVLRNLADRVVFVVRAGASPPAGVFRSLKELKDVGGIVFNRVSAKAFKRYYTYDAYSSYGYDDPDPGTEPQPTSEVVPIRNGARGGRIG